MGFSRACQACGNLGRDPVELGSGLRRGAQVAELRNVRPRNESPVAGTSHHQHTNLGIVLQRPQHSRQGAANGERHGVVLLGLIEGQQGDSVIYFEKELLGTGIHRSHGRCRVETLTPTLTLELTTTARRPPYQQRVACQDGPMPPSTGRRPPPPFRRVTVLRKQHLSARMTRITLAGPDLRGLVVDQPAASVRVLLPPPDPSELILPDWAGNEFPHAGRPATDHPDLDPTPR